MVWGHHNVAMRWPLGEHLSHPAIFQIPRQEYSPTGKIDLEDDTVFIIVGGSCDAASRRMQYVDNNAGTCRESISHSDLSNWHLRALRRLAQMFQRWSSIFKHQRRDVNNSNRTSVQELRYGVVMVKICVREYHGVDMRDAA
jgi:hypothetical protein